MLRFVIEDALVFAGLMATLGCITKIILAILQRRRGLPEALSTTLTEISERLGRLEQASDAMAVEVERIYEGQRFTTKLLAERAGVPNAEPARGRVTTPH